MIGVAAEETAASAAGRPAREWARKYPPLVALVVGLVIALAILPSALNLPQSNPQETVEYAPVPPQDKQNNDTSGNLSALGLAGSSTVGGAGAPGGAGIGAPPSDEGRGVNPGIQCYGNPPKQTDDPLAPPCVPYFAGDNFGATYQGVTKNEVTILFYIDGGIIYVNGSDPSKQGSPPNKCFDLAAPKKPEEHLTTTALRTWQYYFNTRFQTYHRFVRFVACYSGVASPESRRQDAANHYTAYHPFATVIELTEGNEDDYIKEMARHGVLNFGSFGVRPASLFDGFGKMIWSFLPSVEQQAESFASYVCQKVVPFPSAISGNPELNGIPRLLGLIHTTSPDQPGLVRLAKLVKDKVKACGGVFDEPDATYDTCCIARGSSASQGRQDQQMAKFRADNVTTMVWTGGINPHYGRAAAQIGYFPEWIVLGDTVLDAPYPILFGDYAEDFDGHAIVVTPQPFQPALQAQRCYQAFRSVNKTYPESDLAYTCNYYRDLFQLFVGIQVAGPRLGPTSIDKGFHAIPQRFNGNPEVPACFYLPGDYTCVKDAQVQLFDASGVPPGDNRPGCWRSIESGRRYAPNKWPAGNIDAQFGPDQPCSGYNSRVRYNLN